MHKIVLNNGVEMPILGFGVYQKPYGDVCGSWRAMEEGCHCHP
jgi:diketogulonate reductase-like aldo/keto reductase